MTELMENAIDELVKENKFLKQIARIMCTTYAIDNSVLFRVIKEIRFGTMVPNHLIKCDETTEYLDYEDILKQVKNPSTCDRVYNYKEYSNLPENCLLYTVENIVHNGDLTFIYGYLDQETKTLVRYDYDMKKM